MTEKQYRDEIGKACKALGVYRVEFSRTRCRLAQIYVDAEAMNDTVPTILAKLDECLDHIMELEDGDDLDKLLAQLNNITNSLKLMDRQDRLRRTALEHERALGMTADSARKINDAVFSKSKDEEDDPLANALRGLGI